MSDAFIGEIKMFAGTFAPRSFAFCDGQLLAISSNEALFSLLGTTYGGDGRTTFGLPELRGRVPIHQGTGPGLTQRRIGAKAGSETANISTNQLPPHDHEPFKGSSDIATTANPSGNVVARSTSVDMYIDDTPADGMSSTSSVGGGATHNNMMPVQAINFIIALAGVFPSRS